LSLLHLLLLLPLLLRCCRGQPPLFQPIRYGSHLESKVLSNFDL
jgi:hypothetical protein